VAIGDVEAATELDADARETLLALGAHAVLTTPIVMLDRVAGFFELHRQERSTWSSSEIALAETVANEVGLAIQTVTLVDENRVRVQRQSALLNAARALAIDLRFEAVIERLVQEVVTLVGADGADCWLLDRHRRTLSRRAAHGSPAQGGHEMRPEDAMAEAVAGNRPLLNRGEAAAPFAEAMIAPIAFLGEGRGVLRVWTGEEGRFDEDDLDLLEAFATLASLAVRNAEAFEEGTRQARVQRGFYRIASALAEPLSLESTLHALAQAASEALGGAFAAVLMPSLGDELELAGSAGLPPQLAESLTHGLSEVEAPLRAAASEGRVLAAPEVATDERFGDEWRELAAGVGYRSLLAIPVPAPREPEASGLVLVFFVESRSFTDDDLELAHHLAGAARGALDRGAVLEEERTARSLAQQLARSGARLATELEPASVLDEVVEQAPKLAGVEACAIRLVDGEDLVVTAVTGPQTSRVLGARSPASGWVSGDVVQGGAPLAVEDAAGDDRLLAADPLLRLGYRGYLGVPLTSGEGALQGVLAVYSRDPKSWRDAEIEALLALAGNASAALSNAELYQRVAIEKERSDAILANVADGIVAVDREGLVVLWNAAAERITGVPAEEALNRPPADVLQRELESGSDGPLRERLVSIRRGGEEIWLSLTEAVMRDPAGAVAGRIFAFRDISAERVVEQMKSEFVSNVSRELRSPLTSIYGFAETLLRDDVLFGEEERATFLGYIASEAGRLTAIVDRLLAVARLDGGDLQVELSPTDVGAVVSEVVSAARQSLALEGHELVLDLPPEPLTVAADREKLRQIVMDLVDNAVKYSPGGGTVRVSARRRDDTVEVSVDDEGIGIPQAELGRIFAKFYRAETGGRDLASGGTGLGLFIAKELLAAMRGRIWVDSREGQGSTFVFSLPLSGQPVLSERE
jgi:PAS domain S-box-containing protein